jgi:S1-C subfamily serine protease
VRESIACSRKASAAVQILSYGLGIDCEEADVTSSCSVAYVAPSGAAEQAAIATGSRITAFNGTRITTGSSMCALIHASRLYDADLAVAVAGHGPSNRTLAAQPDCISYPDLHGQRMLSHSDALQAAEGATTGSG